MRDLATYHDQNRVIHETDRRLHAADMELSGGYIQVVPAVAEKLAPYVRPSALAWSHGQTLQAEAMETDEKEIRHLRRQRWWLSEWRRDGGLYRLRTLSRLEKDLANALLETDGLPPEAFPRAQGRLADDNDAQMVAQVMACGGRMVVTSNRVLIEKGVLDEWLDRKQNEWPGLTADKLLAEVDPLYTGWWRSHPEAPKLMTRIVLAAYWPENERSTRESILQSAKEGAEALQRGHLKTFGALVAERLRSTDTIMEEMGALRGRLPIEMRKAEQRRRTMLDEGMRDQGDRITPDQSRDVLRRFEWDR